MIATSGVSWGWIKTIYRTLYLLGRQRDYEFREIGLSGPFYKGKYRENGQNRYFFFGMLINTKKTVRWKIKLYPIWKENERGFQKYYRKFCKTSPWRHNDVIKLTLFVIFCVFYQNLHFKSFFIRFLSVLAHQITSYLMQNFMRILKMVLKISYYTVMTSRWRHL